MRVVAAAGAGGAELSCARAAGSDTVVVSVAATAANTAGSSPADPADATTHSPAAVTVISTAF